MKLKHPRLVIHVRDGFIENVFTDVKGLDYLVVNEDSDAEDEPLYQFRDTAGDLIVGSMEAWEAVYSPLTCVAAEQADFFDESSLDRGDEPLAADVARES